MKPFSPHKFANDVFVLVAKSKGLSPPDTNFQHSTGTFSLIIHTLFEIQTFQTLLTCLIHHKVTCESDQQNVLQMYTSDSKLSFSEVTNFDNNKHDNNSMRGIDKFLPTN